MSGRAVPVKAANWAERGGKQKEEEAIQIIQPQTRKRQKGIETEMLVLSLFKVGKMLVSGFTSFHFRNVYILFLFLGGSFFFIQLF